MIGLSALRCLLTLMFVASAGFHLARCLRVASRRRTSHAIAGQGITGHGLADHDIADPHDTEHRAPCGSPAVEALHLLMGVGMVAMIWPWAAAVPVLSWVLVFVGTGLWFTVRAVRAGGRDATSVYSATMSGAMVWMGVTESLGTPIAAAGHPAHGMAASGSGIAPAAAWVSMALGVYLVAAACWWWVRAMRVTTLGGHGTARESVQWIAVCHGLMSAGMGLTLLAMA